MIQNNELRLGNLLASGRLICEVTSLTSGSIGTAPWPNQNGQQVAVHALEYIALSEAWMNKCAGSENGNLTISRLERTSGSSDMILLSTVECYLHDDGFLRVCAYEYEKSPDGTADISDDVIILGYTHIRYVHQLQNLYFELSGKSLQWNP